MKSILNKVLLGITFLTFSIICFNSNNQIAFAENNSALDQTIVIAQPEKYDSDVYQVYKLKNKKMVKVGKPVKTHNSKRIKYWKAQKVTINEKSWWKIGSNKYFKDSKRVKTINMKFREEHKSEYPEIHYEN